MSEAGFVPTVDPQAYTIKLPHDLFCERCGTHIARYVEERPPYRFCGRCLNTAALERVAAALERLLSPPVEEHL